MSLLIHSVHIYVRSSVLLVRAKLVVFWVLMMNPWTTVLIWTFGLQEEETIIHGSPIIASQKTKKKEPVPVSHDFVACFAGRCLVGHCLQWLEQTLLLVRGSHAGHHSKV